MRGYIKDRGRCFFIVLCLWGFGNFYLVFLCASHFYFQDLLYLNLLLLAAAAAGVWKDYCRWKKGREYLEGKISLEPWEQEKIFGKNVYDYLQGKEEAHRKEIQGLIREQEELTDYIARWSHEAKLPLAAMKLINERSRDQETGREMKESIVRLESLIHTVLLGSKLHGPEHDVRYEKLCLRDAIREAVKNQAYFLIRCVQQSWTTLAGASPVTVIASELCS